MPHAPFLHHSSLGDAVAPLRPCASAGDPHFILHWAAQPPPLRPCASAGDPHCISAFDPARRPAPFGAVAALQSMSLRSIDPARRPAPFGAVAALQSMSLRSIQLCICPRLSFDPAAMHDISTIQENYGRFEADDRRWDVTFWQRQGSAAIFDAVWGMILDHRLLTQRDATEPRLQRTVEHFGKA